MLSNKYAFNIRLKIASYWICHIMKYNPFQSFSKPFQRVRVILLKNQLSNLWIFWSCSSFKNYECNCTLWNPNTPNRHNINTKNASRDIRYSKSNVNIPLAVSTQVTLLKALLLLYDSENACTCKQYDVEEIRFEIINCDGLRLSSFCKKTW